MQNEEIVPEKGVNHQYHSRRCALVGVLELVNSELKRDSEQKSETFEARGLIQLIQSGNLRAI